MQKNGQVSSSIFAQYGPKISGPLPGPKASAIIAGDDRYISPSYTRSYPMVAKRGRGVRVEDVDGRPETARFVHRLLPHATHASERAPRWHPT